MFVKGSFQGIERLPADVALQAAADLTVRFPLGPSTIEVGLRARVVALTLNRDDVKCRIQVTVASSIEAMASDQTRRRGKRRCARKHGESAFAANPTGVRPDNQGRCRDDWPDADKLQFRGPIIATLRPWLNGRRPWTKNPARSRTPRTFAFSSAGYFRLVRDTPDSSLAVWIPPQQPARNPGSTSSRYYRRFIPTIIVRGYSVVNTS